MNEILKKKTIEEIIFCLIHRVNKSKKFNIYESDKKQYDAYWIPKGIMSVRKRTSI
jgi:hypothetical protein